MNAPDEKERKIAQGYKEKFSSIFRIVEVEQRETIGASLNRGFLLADTQFTSFLDIDDLRAPDSYERQIATLQENRDVDFTYGDFVTVRKQGETVGRYVKALDFNKRDFIRGCHASPTQMFRTGLLAKAGGFDEQLRSGGDFDFQVRAAFNCKFKKTPGVICYYTKEENSGSASSNVLQPIERTVIELRYGNYDITEMVAGYQYVRRAMKYRLDQLLIGGKWEGIENFVPGYRGIMTRKGPARSDFFHRYRLEMAKYYAIFPFKVCCAKVFPRIGRMLGIRG